MNTYPRTARLLGVSNTHDSIWYRFAPEDETLRLLDAILDIREQLAEEGAPDLYSYAFQTRERTNYFCKDCEAFLAYVIITHSEAHLILRKRREWEPIHAAITDACTFAAQHLKTPPVRRSRKQERG